VERINHNACVELTRILLGVISGTPGLSVSDVLVSLSVAEKLMRKGTADLYQEAPSVSDDEIEKTSETLYGALIASGKKPCN
jgi:hypothetical protein